MISWQQREGATKWTSWLCFLLFPLRLHLGISGLIHQGYPRWDSLILQSSSALLHRNSWNLFKAGIFSAFVQKLFLEHRLYSSSLLCLIMNKIIMNISQFTLTEVRIYVGQISRAGCFASTIVELSNQVTSVDLGGQAGQICISLCVICPCSLPAALSSCNCRQRNTWADLS